MAAARRPLWVVRPPRRAAAKRRSPWEPRARPRTSLSRVRSEGDIALVDARAASPPRRRPLTRGVARRAGSWPRPLVLCSASKGQPNLSHLLKGKNLDVGLLPSPSPGPPGAGPPWTRPRGAPAMQGTRSRSGQGCGAVGRRGCWLYPRELCLLLCLLLVRQELMGSPVKASSNGKAPDTCAEVRLVPCAPSWELTTSYQPGFSQNLDLESKAHNAVSCNKIFASFPSPVFLHPVPTLPAPPPCNAEEALLGSPSASAPPRAAPRMPPVSF